MAEERTGGGWGGGGQGLIWHKHADCGMMTQQLLQCLQNHLTKLYLKIDGNRAVILPR